MMGYSDQLLTFAEISIALAGFAGIIATFQFKKEEHISRGRVLDLSMIVNISLLCAFMSVFPLALLNFGVSERAVWAFCSGVAGVFWLGTIFFIHRNMSADNLPRSLRLLFAFLFTYSTATAVILFLNAAGVVFGQEFGPYFAAFILAFFMVCFNFSRLLMYPLWAALRKQEAEKTAVA